MCAPFVDPLEEAEDSAGCACALLADGDAMLRGTAEALGEEAAGDAGLRLASLEGSAAETDAAGDVLLDRDASRERLLPVGGALAAAGLAFPLGVAAPELPLPADPAAAAPPLLFRCAFRLQPAKKRSLYLREKKLLAHAVMPA